MRKPLLVLIWTIVCGLTFGGAAVAQDAGAQADLATPSVVCAIASLDLGGFDSAIATARKGGGGIDGPTEAGCCYSDPCPTTGSRVSCCSSGVCQAGSTWVYCQETGQIDCSCSCQQGAECTDDSDCNCNQTNPGFCYKEEPFQIVGECSC